jgi:hypothetical protein
MHFLHRSLVLACVGFLAPISGALAEAPVKHDLFDPAHYMRVSEVRAGMTGYGESVFSGTSNERFDVQVISVLKNFNPKDDVILIRCHGANLEHTGSIAGMSGSPIYLKDDQGRDRMIGAFAYGWPLAKDPIAGVQPIQYMLELPDIPANAATEPATQSAATDPATTSTGKPDDAGLIHWSLGDCIPLPGMKRMPPGYPLIGADQFEPSEGILGGNSNSIGLRPLATPLMTSGMTAKTLALFAPLFRAYGLTPLQAGGGGGTDADNFGGVNPATQPAVMVPGSVLVAPLVTGDVDMSAVGTCTDVIGDRIFGFGHPFNNEGPINLPFGAGEINAIVANLQESFKLGSLTKMMGALTTDQSVGVAGHIGTVPAMIPMDIRVVYTDGSVDQTYHFNCVRHLKFTPLLTVAALTAAITGERDLPTYHTLDYDLSLGFANGRSLKIANSIVDDNPAAFFLQVAAPMMAAAENPFEQVLPTKLSGTIHVRPESMQAEILSVNVPKLTYKPGDTVKAYVQYRPFHAEEATLPVEFHLPRDLPDGTYPMVVSGWEQYLTDEQAAQPFRFNANNLREVFDVLRDFLSVRHDSVYVRLVRQADGVALGRSALARLPSSIRQVMLDAGRSDTTAYVSSEVRIFPSQFVMDGSANFAVTIQAAGHGQANRGPRPEMPAPPVTPQNGGKNKKSDVPGEPLPSK